MPSRAQRVVLIALILAAGMSYYYFALLIPYVREVHAHRSLGGGYYFGSDFYPIWCTTRQLIEHKQDPYSKETTRQIQIALFGRTLDARLPGDPPPNYHAFSYPLYTASLAVPVAWMSFPLARIALCFLLPAQIAFAVLLWLRAISPPLSRPLQATIVILVLISYPALEAMFLEQASVAVTIALAAMTWALARGKLALAGTFLALSWVKPHLVILLSIWLVAWSATDWARRKQLVLSFGITLATLLSASEIVMPGWFSAWIASLVEYRHYTEPPLIWFVPGHWIGTTAAITLLMLALLIGGSALRRPDTSAHFQFALAFLLAVTVVTLPSGNAVYEQLLLLPGIIWLGAHRRHWTGHPPSVLLAALALIVVIWPPVVATLVAAASWFAPALRHNVTALALPLRTAASFPFVLLAVLSLSRIRIVSGHSDQVSPPRIPVRSVPNRVSSIPAKAVLATATLLMAASMGGYYFRVFLPNLLAERATKELGGGYSLGNDFYPIWLTTREWFLRHHDPYSPEMTQTIQTGLFGRQLDASRPTDPPSNYRAFAYPVYVDLLVAPISNLSFPAVRAVLLFVLPVLVGVGILRWLRFLDYSPDSWLRFSFVALTIFSYPVLEGLYAEQLGLVVGFLLAAAMAVLRAGRLALSGCLLGFSILKPQMGILLIFCLIVWAAAAWSTRRPLLLASGSVIAFLIISSLVIWGNWIPQWLAVVRSYKDYGTPALVTDLLGPRVGLPVIGALLAGAAWLTWRIRREPAHSETFTLGVCIVLAITSLTLLPGHALYDRVILLPGIFLLIEFRREIWKVSPTLRTLLVLSGLALFWQWIGGAVVLMTRVLAPALSNHAWFLLLPIRATGTVPFAVLATLALVWRDVQEGKLILRQA